MFDIILDEDFYHVQDIVGAGFKDSEIEEALEKAQGYYEEAISDLLGT